MKTAILLAVFAYLVIATELRRRADHPVPEWVPGSWVPDRHNEVTLVWLPT